MCGLHEQRWRKHRAFEAPAKEERPWAVCGAEDCCRPARTPNGAMCEMHYYRARRASLPKKPQRPKASPPVRRVRDTHVQSGGYRMRKVPDHPLAGRNGWVYEHRIVVFLKYGPGEQRCHWCDLSLSWKEAVVDHINEAKTDNRPSNLVVACSPCNRARGSMIPFIRRMRADRLACLIDTFDYMRGSHQSDDTPGAGENSEIAA